MATKKRTLRAIDLNGNPLQQFGDYEFEIWEDTDGKVHITLDKDKDISGSTIDDWNRGGGGGGSDVIINPELEGDEDRVEGIEVNGTKYKMPVQIYETAYNIDECGFEDIDISKLEVGDIVVVLGKSGDAKSYVVVSTLKQENNWSTSLFTVYGSDLESVYYDYDGQELHVDYNICYLDTESAIRDLDSEVDQLMRGIIFDNRIFYNMYDVADFLASNYNDWIMQFGYLDPGLEFVYNIIYKYTQENPDGPLETLLSGVAGYFTDTAIMDLYDTWYDTLSSEDQEFLNTQDPSADWTSWFYLSDLDYNRTDTLEHSLVDYMNNNYEGQLGVMFSCTEGNLSIGGNIVFNLNFTNGSVLDTASNLMYSWDLDDKNIQEVDEIHLMSEISKIDNWTTFSYPQMMCDIDHTTGQLEFNTVADTHCVINKINDSFNVNLDFTSDINRIIPSTVYIDFAEALYPVIQDIVDQELLPDDTNPIIASAPCEIMTPFGMIEGEVSIPIIDWTPTDFNQLSEMFVMEVQWYARTEWSLTNLDFSGLDFGSGGGGSTQPTAEELQNFYDAVNQTDFWSRERGDSNTLFVEQLYVREYNSDTHEYGDWEEVEPFDTLLLLPGEHMLSVRLEENIRHIFNSDGFYFHEIYATDGLNTYDNNLSFINGNYQAHTITNSTVTSAIVKLYCTVEPYSVE